MDSNQFVMVRDKKELWLSSSRLKNWSYCSFKYYAEYILKLRGGGNFSTARGSCVHDLFACLLKKNRRNYVDGILKEGSIQNFPSIRRFIELSMNKSGFGKEYDDKDINNYALIEEMIIEGLKHNFFCDEKEILYDLVEEEFQIENENPRYKIRGFIDKIAKKGNIIYIYDYKSNKNVFSEGELAFEIQALVYLLYAKKILGMEGSVEFIFLRHGETRCVEASDEQLKGFEEYLSSVYTYLEDFTIEKAMENMAADKGYPSDGSFSGKIMCGYAKHEGHCYSDTHKDPTKRGKPYYHCPFKFAFDYYTLRDPLGGIIQSSKNKEELVPKEGEYITEEIYKGCPKFQNNN